MSATATAAGETPEHESPELRVPLFESAVARLDDGRRHVVMDLGPARSGTISTFGSLRCRLDIADLPSMLAGPEAEEESAPGRRLAAALPPPRGESTDLILCWGLFNYIPTESIAALMGALARRSVKGTRVHALIEYSARSMPAIAPVFAATGRDRLCIESPPGTTVATPRLAARDLEACMAGFRHERTMLLGNGMQEYLFVR